MPTSGAVSVDGHCGPASLRDMASFCVKLLLLNAKLTFAVIVVLYQ